jgi:DNA-binding transcriptional regulator LsrR (DeoR family)
MRRNRELGNAYAAAYLYYEKKLTQEEVARRMGVSRPTVSRLLNLATSEDIVRISVHRPGRRDLELQNAFADALGLEASVVLPGAPGSAQALDILLAQGVLELLKERLPTLPRVQRVGLGWGQSVLAFVEAVEQSDMFLSNTAEVVPLVGGSGQGLENFHINEMVRRVARALGARPRMLHAPALVADEKLRASLFAEASVGVIVEAWQELDVAVVGVGGRIDPHYRHAYIDEHLLDETLVSAAVGDVCAHYFDIGGKALGEEYDAKLVAISRDKLVKTPLVVGVAGGPGKIAGIVGAARAGLIKALVTDKETANGCLEVANAA